MNDILLTHYTNLQIVENASDEVIKGAYKYLAQKYHPDKNPGKEGKYKNILQIITKAYEVLSNPESRRRHDEWIKQKREECQKQDIDDRITKKAESESENISTQEASVGTALCKNCSDYIDPTKIKRGSTTLNIVLFLLFWPAWIIHFLYAYGYKDICPKCGYVISTDRRKAGIIMMAIFGVIGILIACAVKTHVSLAPSCTDPQVTQLVLEIANERLEYPYIGLRNTSRVSRDRETGVYGCKGQLYATDNKEDFIDITYSSEPSKDKHDEFYVSVDGI